MINLGDKNWGVKDSGLLAYKQVGSKFFNKDFDFTRSSDATYIDKNGVLQTQSLYNLIDYSQDFSQWDLVSIGSADAPTIIENYIQSPSGILNAYRLQMETNGSSSSDQSYIKDSIALDGSSNYVFSFYIKSNTGVDQELISLINSSFDERFTATSEWTRIELNLTSNTTNNRNFGLMARGDIEQSIDVSIYGAQIVEGTEPRDYQYTNGRVGIPRVDFSDGVGALLLEPQTTNLVTYSEDFTQWNTAGDTILESGYLAPDGTNSAYRISSDSLDGFVYLGITGGVTTTTKSIYARSVNGTGQVKLLSKNDNTNNTFTLTEQWQRFDVNSTSTAASLLYAVDFRAEATLNEIIVWGANATNDQTYPTSYIKTEGSQVTRIADVANNCGTEQDFNSEEGVLYFETKSFLSNGEDGRISISDGTINNRIEFSYGAGNSKPYCIVELNSVSIIYNLTLDLGDLNEYKKFAIKYKSGDSKFYVNGNEIISSSVTYTNTNALDNLQLGNSTLASNLYFYGKVRSVKYFPTALTDEELENLTT